MTRVLIAEDDESFLASLADALRREGHEVVAVSNGRDALDALSSQHIDLLLTDIKMPKLDGIGLLREVLNHGGFLPCIVMTAYGTPELERRTTFSGGLEFVNKPIDLPALRERMRELLAIDTDSSVVHGLTVASFTQLLGIERKTCTVKVRSGERSGILFLAHGDLVGAAFDDTDGIDAACEILTWDQAEISIRSGCPRSARTFRESLDGVLLEAMRRMDEHSHAVSRSPGVTIAAPEREPRGKEAGMPLESFLDEFKGVNGYIASGIMDFTGETLAIHSTNADVDLAAFGAIFNDIFRSAHEASKKIGLDACRNLAITTPRGIVVMECSGVDSAAHLHLIVILQEGGNQALVKLTLTKLVPKVVTAMS